MYLIYLVFIYFWWLLFTSEFGISLLLSLLLCIPSNKSLIRLSSVRLPPVYFLGELPKLHKRNVVYQLNVRTNLPVKSYGVFIFVFQVVAKRRTTVWIATYNLSKFETRQIILVPSTERWKLFALSSVRYHPKYRGSYTLRS